MSQFLKTTKVLVQRVPQNLLHYHELIQSSKTII